MVKNITYKGEFLRSIGLFKYPAELGVFSLLVITYQCFIIKDSLKWRKMLTCIGGVVLGLFSASKSFLIGIIILIMLLIYNSIELFRNGKSILISLVPLAILLIMLLFKEDFIFFLDSLDFSIAHHVSFYIKNLSNSLSNRFGENGSFTTTNTLDFIKHNILFGVGPTSMSGEYIIDNAFLSILHNGGIVALDLILFFYIKTVLKFTSQERLPIILSVIILFSTGMAYDTLTISGTVSSWFVFSIILMSQGNTRKENGKIEEVL